MAVFPSGPTHIGILNQARLNWNSNLGWLSSKFVHHK